MMMALQRGSFSSLSLPVSKHYEFIRIVSSRRRQQYVLLYCEASLRRREAPPTVRFTRRHCDAGRRRQQYVLLSCEAPL
jgi:hypothetical protein